MEIMYHQLHFSDEKGEGHMTEDIYLMSAKTPVTAAGAGSTSPIAEPIGYPSVNWIIWMDTWHCHRVTGDFPTWSFTVTLSDIAAHVSLPGPWPHNKHKINAEARQCKTLYTNRPYMTSQETKRAIFPVPCFGTKWFFIQSRWENTRKYRKARVFKNQLK